MANEDVQLTLDDAVAELLSLLYGIDLRYLPEQDKYQTATRFLNMALRRNALENEWSYYASVEDAGAAVEGQRDYQLRSSVRMRIITGDAVRLAYEGRPVKWAHILPRDSLHQKEWREGLWCAITRNTLSFSRPIWSSEAGLEIQVPVMREPVMFRLPQQPEDPDADLIPVPDDIINQPVDFDFPDVIVARAAYMWAQSDPVLQPRAQTLEADYKDLMYQLIERDERHTDSPDLNGWNLPMQSSLYPESMAGHGHPHADERR